MDESTNKKYLVSFDTDGIQDYIFATNGLKEIRGASAILLKQDAARKRYGGIIYTAGGGGALVADSAEQAREFTTAIQSEFLQHTHSATITAITVENEAFEDGSKFLLERQKSMQQLGTAKREKAKLIDLPVEPYFRLCDICGVRIAECRQDEYGEPFFVCLSCNKKITTGNQVRRSKTYRFGILREFFKYIDDHQKKVMQDVKLVQSLAELGDLDRSGYVGYITMDGNQMGALLAHIYSKEKLKQYADELARTIHKLVYQTLLQVIGTENLPGRFEVLPFERVLIGGDDIKIFTTASIALTFATRFMKEFQDYSDHLLETAGLTAANLQNDIENRVIFEPEKSAIDALFCYKNKKLTMSAGVVLCHPNFPIPTLVEIGENLLKNAKKYAANMTTNGVKTPYRDGAIDFQVITGTAMDIDQARQHMPHNRPYSLAQASKLLSYAKEIAESGYPMSQFQMVYQACHQSKVDGTMTLLRLLTRLKNNRLQDQLKKFLIEFSQPDEKQPTLWPWVKYNTRHWRTSLTDLIEILEFVR